MDEHGFEQRVAALEPRLYRIAYALLWRDADVADALQESLLKAWRKLGRLRQDDRFDAWLTAIVVNECKTMLRRRKWESAAPPQEESYMPPEDQGLQDALRRLPEKYRLPLLLHHLDGYSIQAISQMLHLPASTVKGRLYEGRRRLNALLREEDHL